MELNSGSGLYLLSLPALAESFVVAKRSNERVSRMKNLNTCALAHLRTFQRNMCVGPALHSTAQHRAGSRAGSGMAGRQGPLPTGSWR